MGYTIYVQMQALQISSFPPLLKYNGKLFCIIFSETHAHPLICWSKLHSELF